MLPARQLPAKRKDQLFIRVVVRPRVVCVGAVHFVVKKLLGSFGILLSS